MSVVRIVEVMLETYGDVCNREVFELERSPYGEVPFYYINVGFVYFNVVLFLDAERRNQVVTEQHISRISNEVGTCWRKLAPELGISAVACELIEEDYRGSAEKATQLLIQWMRLESSNATVGRLADALVKIGKKLFAEKLLAL